jgi:hypothetical protein
MTSRRFEQDAQAKKAPNKKVPAKKLPAKKSPQKTVNKEASSSEDEFLYGEDEDYSASVKKAPAKDVKFEESESSDDEARDYSDLDPYDSRQTLTWWVLGKPSS